MRSYIRSVVVGVAVTGSGVFAGKGKSSKDAKGSSAGSVLSGVLRATGLGAALGAMPMASGIDVHPKYNEVQADLSGLLSAPCTASACPMEERFRQWANDMKKPYVTQQISEVGEEGKEGAIMPTKGMEDEYAHRLIAFKDNVKIAQNHNIKSKGSSVHGITKFMDLPEDEFMRQRGGMNLNAAAYEKFMKLPKFKKSSTEFLDHKQASGHKDWSEEGYTTDIKDQGQCGSCWAFSTVEQVESMAIKAGITDPEGENYVLAPQELVSCDHNGDEGCNGGLPTNALEWLETKPLVQEDDYPYRSGDSGSAGHCKLRKSEGVIEVESYKKVSSHAYEEDDLVDYLLTEGPVSVAVDANSAWQTYIGGVLTADQCEGELDHAVQAVGVDTEASKPYIKVRNSWAEDWGEEGFIRLAQGTNTCGVATAAVTADVKDVSGNKATVV